MLPSVGPAYLPSPATRTRSVSRTRKHDLFGGNIMTTLSVVAAIWGLFVVAFIGLMVYRGHLTQHETDQLFLSESAPHSVQEENDDIIRRVNFIQPICKGVGGAAALFTVLVVGVWFAKVFSTSHF
jgi:hypothetical protein